MIMEGRRVALCVVRMGGRRERLLALCVLVLMCVWGVRCVHAIDCKAEVRSLVNSCKPVLYGKVPSSACCAAIRAAHVGCVCPKITPRLAPLIDVKRAVRIVRGCGRRVPRHFKCGNGFLRLLHHITTQQLQKSLPS
ncbi:hypothetical protein AMTRI_Chr11g157710 [Amborella trichopoda]